MLLFVGDDSNNHNLLQEGRPFIMRFQLAMKPKDSCGPRVHCLTYSVFYCTVWTMRRRSERLYEQLDMLQYLRQQARRELLAESRKHAITAKL